MVCAALAGATAGVLPVSVLAHRMDAAVTTVDFRPGGTLEVTHRLFAHDLEHTLDLGPIGVGWFDTAEGQRALGRYASSRFLLRTQEGADVPLRYLGAETERDLVFIYFEGMAPTASILEVDSDLLVEFSSAQRNLVNVQRGDRTASATFGASDGPARLVVPK
jgi:hypothetical protein